MRRERPNIYNVWRSYAKSSEPLILGLAGVVGLVLLWSLVIATGAFDALVFPSPAATAGALVELFASGEIYPHLLASVRLLVLGYAVGVIAGTVIGFAAGWFPSLRAVLVPHVSLLYSMPTIGLLPLFIVFLGIGFASQFAVVVLDTFFAAYYSAVDAVDATDRNLARMARSFGARDVRLFRTIILPGSVPLLISGFRIALGKAITAVLLVELYASALGLGYLLNVSGIRFATATVFAIIFLVAIFGFTVSQSLRSIEQRFDHWRPGGQHQDG